MCSSLTLSLKHRTLVMAYTTTLNIDKRLLDRDSFYSILGTLQLDFNSVVASVEFSTETAAISNYNIGIILKIILIKSLLPTSYSLYY